MKRSLFLLVPALLLAGCSSVDVRRDYDPAIDFASLKTFAWRYEKQPQTGNPQVDNDLTDARVRRAVEAELLSKGFRPVPKDEADVLVEYFIGFRSRVTGSGGSVSMGLGLGSGAGRYGGVGLSSGSTIREIDEAVLTIDFRLPADERLIWRGVGSRPTTSSTNPERITNRMNDAVGRILKAFPPRS